MVKSDEIYRQKPIDRQNYGFSQKLILYICTQTVRQEVVQVIVQHDV